MDALRSSGDELQPRALLRNAIAKECGDALVVRVEERID
jgi:hypothetical protein